VDNAAAVEVGLRLKDWLHLGCTVLACSDVPEIAVEIVPDEGLEMGWSQANPWLLEMPSPYVRLARSDMLFDFDMQLKAARLLAERLATISSEYLQPVYPADAYYLHEAVISWLVGRFVRIDTNSFLVDSLARNYGEPAVGALLRSLKPDSSMNVLAQVTGVSSLDQANLEWRDLLTWRLVTEADLILRGDVQGYFSLYDTRDETVRSLATMRYDAQAPAERMVVAAQTALAPDGTIQLRATVHGSQNRPAKRWCCSGWWITSGGAPVRLQVLSRRYATDQRVDSMGEVADDLRDLRDLGDEEADLGFGEEEFALDDVGEGGDFWHDPRRANVHLDFSVHERAGDRAGAAIGDQPHSILVTRPQDQTSAAASICPCP
jgi:hypothetical protein